MSDDKTDAKTDVKPDQDVAAKDVTEDTSKDEATAPSDTDVTDGVTDDVTDEDDEPTDDAEAEKSDEAAEAQDVPEATTAEADQPAEAEAEADASEADEDEAPEDTASDDVPHDVQDEPAPAAATAPMPKLPPDPADAARRRLRRALVPRATRSQLLAAVVCALLGFAVVVQARQTQVASLASLREGELVAVLDNVSQQSARLDAQTRALEQTLDELRTSSDRAPAARQAAQERLDVLGVLAGTLPATGPGIEVEIPDPQKVVTATQILEAVQELRDAGAEVMQFGPVRVVASTSFVDDAAGLLVDGTTIAPPYTLRAIGNPQNLTGALQIPGGVIDGLRSSRITPTVRSLDQLTITALRTPRAPQYARPAPSAR